MPKSQAHTKQEVQDGLVNLMTIMYMFIQVALGDPEGTESVRDQLSKCCIFSVYKTNQLNSAVSLQPCLPVYMLTVTTKFRFFEPKDDSVIVPHVQVGSLSRLVERVLPNYCLGALDALEVNPACLWRHTGD